MKIYKQFTLWVLMLLLCLALSACVSGTGGQVNNQAGKDIVTLDAWMAQTSSQILHEFVSNSFVKGRPFIIVSATEEQLDLQVDNVTRQLRSELTSMLLKDTRVELVMRHPVSSFSRPYSLADIRCDNYVEPEIFLTIDMKRVGQVSDRMARINIRAMDLEKNAWVRGISFYENVMLNPVQNNELDLKNNPDTQLKGLRYFPFSLAQSDQMAAYLARNLTCIFKDRFDAMDISVFIDPSKASPLGQNTVWNFEKELNKCNEIQAVREKDKADWIIELQDRETSPGSGLYQLWVTGYQQKGSRMIKGLATSAYFTAQGKKTSGRWKIFEEDTNRLKGFFEVFAMNSKEHRGTILSADHHLIAKDIPVLVDDRTIGWEYYDSSVSQLNKCRGMMDNAREVIYARCQTFPGGTSKLRLERVR